MLSQRSILIAEWGNLCANDPDDHRFLITFIFDLPTTPPVRGGGGHVRETRYCSARYRRRRVAYSASTTSGKDSSGSSSKNCAKIESTFSVPRTHTLSRRMC